MGPLFFFFSGLGGASTTTTPVAGRGKRRKPRYFAEINGQRIYASREELEALIISLREQDEPEPVLKQEPVEAPKAKEPPKPVTVAVRKSAPPVDMSILEGLVAEYFSAVGRTNAVRQEAEEDEEEALALLLA